MKNKKKFIYSFFRHNEKKIAKKLLHQLKMLIILLKMQIIKTPPLLLQNHLSVMMKKKWMWTIPNVPIVEYYAMLLIQRQKAIFVAIAAR